jgi:hypothetical protein
MLHLPILLYSYNKRKKRYEFESCFQYAVRSEAPGSMSCGAGLSILVDNVELVKSIMNAPALILRNNGKLKALNCSGEEVSLPLDVARWFCFQSTE